MRFSTVAAALLPVGAAIAQTTWPVSVGGPAVNGVTNLTFTPNQYTGVQAGDIISFTFQAGDHSATQSSFTEPCTRIAGGFDTGLQNASASPVTKTFTVPSNNTGPLWFYCAQTNPISHCHEGMVFAINPTANKTFATFQQTAKESNTTSTSSSSSASSSASSTSGTGLASSSSSATSAGSSSGTPTTTIESTTTPVSVPTTLAGTAAASAPSASPTSPSSSSSSSNTSSSAPATTSSNAATTTGAGPAGVLLSGLGFLLAAIL